MANKLEEGGGCKALGAGPLKKKFVASLSQYQTGI